MKNSLINTKLPIVYSYNDLQTNLVTVGVIISIQEYGLLVKLFGDLCGLVPKNEIGQLQALGTTNVKSQLQQMFYVGQTVSCKVLNFDEEPKKITLSLKVCINNSSIFTLNMNVIFRFLAKPHSVVN